MSNHDQFDSGKPPPEGDKNYAGVLIGVNWAVFAPATFVVALRVYTRWRISHNIGWDDAMIVLAQVSIAEEGRTQKEEMMLTEANVGYQLCGHGLRHARGPLRSWTAQLLPRSQPLYGLPKI